MSRVPGKFACRILIQEIGFALPVTITVPVVISLLITFCGLRYDDPCYFRGIIPDYLFFKTPDFYVPENFLNEEVRNHNLLHKMAYMQKPRINCAKKNPT
jgi:ABC-type polysaccharide/polyol phosphate export permease